MIDQLFSLYGDVIPLKFDHVEANISDLLKPFDSNWKQYNSKKPHIKRFGLSITSLDGGLSGHPDLDSVKEYNEINNLKLDEADFNKKTPVINASASLFKITSKFSSLGRSHFIKFGAGGFFPYHRDGNFRLPAKSFRVFSLVNGNNKSDFVWLQEDRRLELIPGKWYAINTFKEHSVFAYTENTMIAVLNIPVSEENINVIIDHMEIS